MHEKEVNGQNASLFQLLKESAGFLGTQKIRGF